MLSLPSRPRIWPWLAVSFIYAASVVYARVLYAPCDDTYIYLIYAKNFLAGNGLTFNGARVQGFTSVLWMSLLALGGKLPLELPSVANLFSMAAGFFVLAMTYRAARVFGIPAGWALLPVAMLALNGDFAFYMSNGLETVLFAGVLVWSMTFAFVPDASRALRALRSIALPVVLALATLARPEGALVAAIVTVSLLVRSRDPRGFGRCIAVFVALVLPVIVAGRIYYGDWVPNTYYAKSGAGLANVEQGARYFANFVDGISIPFAAVLALALFAPQGFGARSLPLWLLTAAWVLHLIVRGGDNLAGARMFVPILPIVYLLFAAGLCVVPKRYAVFVVALSAVFQLAKYNFGHAYGSSWDVPVKRQVDKWSEYFVYRRDIGLWLAENTDSSTVIAVNPAGVIPYYAERPTIDMLGLNNRYIARHGNRDRSLAYGHQAGDGEYVLDQLPDVILLGGAGDAKAADFLSDREITKIGKFKRFYDAKLLPHNSRGYFKNNIAPKREPGNQGR